MDSSNDHNRQHRHRHREGHHFGAIESRHQKRQIITLAKAQVGDRLWIAGYETKAGINRLLGMGLAPGIGIEVLQNLAGNLVISLGESRIGIDEGMAKRILVSDQPFDYLVEVQEVNQDMASSKTTLRDLQVNQKGKVSHYETTDDPTKKAYRKKLLAMGLTPGTEFTITRVAPLGDPVEILVRGFKLSLRKDEAAALIVEQLEQ